MSSCHCGRSRDWGQHVPNQSEKRRKKSSLRLGFGVQLQSKCGFKWSGLHMTVGHQKSNMRNPVTLRIFVWGKIFICHWHPGVKARSKQHQFLGVEPNHFQYGKRRVSVSKILIFGGNRQFPRVALTLNKNRPAGAHQQILFRNLSDQTWTRKGWKTPRNTWNYFT